MKITNQSKWAEYLAKLSHQFLKKKIIKGRKREAGRKDWSFQRKQSLADLYQKELCSRPTAAEIVFGNYLLELGVTPFYFQKVILSPKIFILDFFTRGCIAFEIDGESHIGKESKDAERDATLLFYRHIKTYRFTNHEVLTKPDETKGRIKKALSWE